MGKFQHSKYQDEWQPDSPGNLGSASTTSTAVIDEAPKNPIGFLWLKDESISTPKEQA